jgi:acyl-CoA synthetase (AMP-forming)/AMP-acid ligase II/FAD/FMN-containing dehydrogenase
MGYVFDGFVLAPGNAAFEKARRVWNGTIDRTPALIARCRTTSDVSAVVRFAHDAGLPVSIRCGGHNVAGSAVADGAIMIDLSLMRTVTVDVHNRIAEADGGCLLRDVDMATTAHGLACPAGVFSYTGLGGLALRDGYGRRCRKWGLTCDHIIGADMVLADGSVVEVSESRHSDLLRALRGGGGNFGVVTRFKLRLRQAGPILLRNAVYSGDDVATGLQSYREFTSIASDDFHLLGALRHARPGDAIAPALADRPVLDLLAVCSADDADSLDEGSSLFASMPKSAITERSLSYLDLQAMLDDSAPSGRRYYTESGYLAELADGAIEQLVDAARRNPCRSGSIDIEHLMGAVSRVTSATSAFPQHDAPFMVSVYGSWDDSELDAEIIAWARETMSSVTEWEHSGGYVNCVSQEESPEDASDMYGSAIDSRLALVKRRYDPDNMFRGVRGVLPTFAGPSGGPGRDGVADEWKSLTDGVFRHAIEQPTAPALRWRGDSVSYAGLAELILRAHGDLATHADDDDRPVAIVAKKSPETIALILACVTAKRAVLLPSPDLRMRALDQLAERSGCRRIATMTGTGTDWRAVETSRSAQASATARFLLTTSGSTGAPKIVPLKPEAAERFTRWAADEFGLGPGVNVLNHAPLNFDLCLLDVWATLQAGGCVTLVEPDRAVDPRHLVELFETSDIHVVQAVPMFFRILTEAAGTARYVSVRDVVLTGDHTPRRVRAALPELFPNARLHNVYGCTETNDSFIYTFDAATAANRDVLPLGRALPEVAFRVMADGRELNGPGNGELWVSTPFQTHGYLDDDKSRLVRSTDGATYFQTGDVVARDLHGDLTVLGRTDFQVKVRGMRVNLEDVELVIREHEDVADVGVVAVPDPHAGTRLHAVVQRRSDELTGLGLRQHCAERLNRAAIPSVIRIVDTPLPMTSTGKIKRDHIVVNHET